MNKTRPKVVVQAKSLYRCLTSLAYFMIFLLEKYMIHILNLSCVQPEQENNFAAWRIGTLPGKNASDCK